ncbi:MAG TPA: hypothetical protein VFV19_00800 [Candidatus Polarisedimenticolaceae bacterium]|nr:hypothetical protein [Candidatus Polarisedimenticolaceae bacterium]
MRKIRLITVAFTALVLALPALAVTMNDGVPLYTNEDLNKMFGPPPKGPSVPVDKSKPEDWLAIQQFIDNQYTRLDAEREYEMQRQAMAGTSPQEPTGGSTSGYYGAYYPGYYPGYYNNYFHPSGRYYRPNNPQLPFGNRQLPRALPPGGLYPTLQSHATYHPNRPIVNNRPMVAPRTR